MKTKKEEDENKLLRFGGQFITSLKPVQDKILRKEKKIDEKKIFDFDWKEGQPVKKAKKDKKKGSYQQLGMVFYNPMNKYSRIENVY
tara:strand:+ start:967 stop:1227 length:261 start_codon:yes stop_codon:yes gene_type:complete